MEKRRLEYLDMAKGVGILGVIAMHSGLLSTEISCGISQMAVPLFFLASGMVIGCTGEAERESGVVLKRKARSLMLPYLWFSILYILRDLLRFWLGLSGPEGVLAGLRDFVSLFGSSVLWFLTTLFFSEMIFILLRRRLPTLWTCIICPILAVVSYRTNGFILNRQPVITASPLLSQVTLFVQGLLRAAYALPFLAIGYLLFEAFRDFWEAEQRFSPVQFGAGVLVLGAGICLNMRHAWFDFRILYLGPRPVLVYLLATIPFAGLLLIGKNCGPGPVRGLIYLGKNSLIIMVTHLDFYVMNAALRVMHRAMEKFPAGNPVFFHVLFGGVILAAEVICITVVNRFFPFLIGKRKYSHSK